MKYLKKYNLFEGFKSSDSASDITEEGIFIKGELELKTDSDSKIRQIKIKYSKENK